MINTTDRPLITSGVNADELNVATRAAIAYTISEESCRLGGKKGEVVYRYGKHMPSFAYFFDDELKSNRVFDVNFIQSAFDFSQSVLLRKMQSPIPNIENILLSSNQSTASGLLLQSIRSGLRTMFLHLWSKNKVLLPLNFSYDASISDAAMKQLLTPVAFFFWSFGQAEQNIVQETIAKKISWSEKEIKCNGMKLMWTTNWHLFGQVNIYELGVLYAKLMRQGGFKSKIAMSIRNMLIKLHEQVGNQVSFDANQLELFSRWVKGGNYKGYSFKKYSENLSQIKLERKQKYSGRNSELSRKRYLHTKIGAESAEKFDLSIPTILSLLKTIADQNTHEATVEYFEKLRGLNRGYDAVTDYPYREYVDVKKLSRVWQATFKGWLEFKQAQGYESFDSAKSVLSILSDYLFCYLPWWRELYPNANFEFPATPADFTRFKFLISSNKPIKIAPLSLMELLKKRRRTENSQGQAVTILKQFFEYLSGYKELYPELKDREVKNPFFTTLDYPKGRKRNSKTNKIPFPKKVMPFLLRYFYAVEEFGAHLQNLSIEGKTPLPLHRQPIVLKPKDYNFELKFEYNEKLYRVAEVPNVFAVTKRRFQKANGTFTVCLIPSISALRMLIVALETGLRLQSIQWLDLRTWDAPNAGKPADEAVYCLHVNTDKTKNEPWITPILARSRNVLLREQSFQLAGTEKTDRLIPYEKRPNSRFADVFPLFRSGREQGSPVADNSYHETWLRMLQGFQDFYNTQVSRQDYTKFVEIGPCYVEGIQQAGNETIEYDADERPYCPLRYIPIHTPHAARSSFISHRTGILDTEEIMRLVGHNNELVTYHYTVEEHDQIIEKLQSANNELWNFDSNNPVHVRADLENSALKRSLNKNRRETEKRFGFISISLINEKDEELTDGVELLRTTPMSQVVFRETHICPVGEMCPKDIHDLIFEPRRCGLCPLAVKSIDHLPAITAKMRLLLEQIRNAAVQLKKRIEQHEPEAVLDEINERRKLDALEFIGWNQALQHLNEMLGRLKEQETEGETIYQVDQPEVVKRHLRLVAKKSRQTEFILERIADAKFYPSMETPALCARANILRQQLLADVNRVEEELAQIPEGDEIEAFLASMSAVMKSFELNEREVIERHFLENGRGVTQTNSKLLATENFTSSTRIN